MEKGSTIMIGEAMAPISIRNATGENCGGYGWGADQADHYVVLVGDRVHAHRATMREAWQSANAIRRGGWRTKEDWVALEAEISLRRNQVQA